MGQYFVDVWQGDLQVVDNKLQSMAELLSDGERSKADGFSTLRARNRFVAVRGFLRQTLAGYLHVEPVSLQFAVGEYGKPALADGALHFNVSHTADFLLIAIANFADIGVDIEAIKPCRNLDNIAQRCFSRREYECWRSLPDGLQTQAFYRLWTKKEAFVKATGRGIAMGLERCEIGLDADGQLQAIPNEYGSAADWMARELTVDVSVCAALVTPCYRYELRQLDLDMR